MSLDFKKWHEEQLLSKPRHPYARWAILSFYIITTILTLWLATEKGGEERFYAMIFMPLVASIAFSPFTALLTPISVLHDRLDEYQRALRDRVQAVSFQIITIAAVLLCIWGWLAADFELPFPQTGRQWLYLQFLFLFSAIVLPVTLAEWMVPFRPDPLDDE